MEIRSWSGGAVFSAPLPMQKERIVGSDSGPQRIPKSLFGSAPPDSCGVERYRTGPYSQFLHHPHSMCSCCYRFAFGRSPPVDGFIIGSMIAVPH
jgi:hypothetical protein